VRTKGDLVSEPAAYLAAIDLGASSGRVILGRVSPDGVRMEELHRFRNGPVHLPDGLYWDVLGLYQDVLVGLRAAVRRCAAEGEPLRGVAADSWAVDYGLLDSRGGLVANPRHYRDPRTGPAIAAVHERVKPVELYAVNGLQFLPFNTLYQFAAEPDLDGRAALLIPDLLGYWLSGVQAAEETNASTTGLLNAHTGDWDAGLMHALGLPPGLLPDIVPAGRVLGPLHPRVRHEIGGDETTLVTTVGSHDTASAVVGVPATTPDFAYVSCGTWGLVGVELDEPVLTDAGRAANFTNERGVDGTIRYLRNVMGLWLLSESIRTWNLAGPEVDLDAVLDEAGRLPGGGPTIDPNDPVYLPPGDMPARIREACRAAGDPVPATVPQVVRCILDSLAAAFARAVEEVGSLSGRSVDVVHVVGGGSRNRLLCQLVADACGRRVVAGPVEATAIGNLLVQARTLGILHGNRWALRAVMRSTLQLSTYDPTTARAEPGGGK
jgi:rhamnulokinase